MRTALVLSLLSGCATAGFHHARRPEPPSATAASTVFVTAREELDARYWTERAMAHVRAEQPTLALAVCAAATTREPELDTVCGLAALRAGDQSAARAWWETAASAGSVPAMHELSRLALAQHDVETALRITEAWVTAAPREYEAWRLRGRACRLANDFEAARAAFERAMAIEPERPDAHYELGVLWMTRADRGEADERRAAEHFNHFVARAGGRAEYRAAVETVVGCAILGDDARARARARRRARRDGCRGFLDRPRPDFSPTLYDLEEMQRLAAEMEAANAAAAAELDAASHEDEARRAAERD